MGTFFLITYVVGVVFLIAKAFFDAGRYSEERLVYPEYEFIKDTYTVVNYPGWQKDWRAEDFIGVSILMAVTWFFSYPGKYFVLSIVFVGESIFNLGKASKNVSIKIKKDKG